MTDDRTQRRELPHDPEQHEAEYDATTPEADNDPPAAPAERSDSEQAQDNLERMLETGEENPTG
jgi:hypothetical protein